VEHPGSRSGTQPRPPDDEPAEPKSATHHGFVGGSRFNLAGRVGAELGPEFEVKVYLEGDQYGWVVVHPNES
jgi:hypothetical protein